MPKKAFKGKKPVLSIQVNDKQKWQFAALVISLGAVVYWLAPVLVPFAVSALLAYLADPIVDRLERWGMGRTLAVLVVFLIMALVALLVVLGLVPLLERQINRLLEKLPIIVNWVNTQLGPWLREKFDLDAELLDTQKLIEIMRGHWQQAGGVATAIIASVSKSGLAIISFIGTLALVPVVTFYLLRDWDKLVERVRELLPRAIEPRASQLARESDEVLGAFLRGQLSVMAALGAIYSAGLMMLGVDLAILIGMFAGLISFVPYLGLVVGGSIAVIVSAVQFQDWFHPAMVVAVFAAGQLLEGFVLTPMLVGDRVGLHPVAVIFAILAGGQLFGFLGILLALPAAAVLVVLLKHAHQKYLSSELYGAAVGEASPSMVADEKNATVKAAVVVQSSAPASAPTAQQEPQSHATAVAIDIAKPPNV